MIDADAKLHRALMRSAERAGFGFEVVASGCRAWRSATFEGARHELTVASHSPDAMRQWLHELPEADMRVAGHLIADIGAVFVNERAQDGRSVARIEALTVAE
ncbi:hypothetical protein [Stakelama tenebrarum]|uniref:Uncharacterized protein n=1 Tax=Stakelama tenebrarum TaxID=2711215 RepID=A0A6G6Y5M1_9SPHN|nr:hypothetical protein [Sphingosinithalassobacter tenebrarum]QIG80097.1 hypothetical protein G5C33_10100 [Sphingosinithalassobacter tenebrarum]